LASCRIHSLASSSPAQFGWLGRVLLKTDGLRHTSAECYCPTVVQQLTSFEGRQNSVRLRIFGAQPAQGRMQQSFRSPRAKLSCDSLLDIWRKDTQCFSCYETSLAGNAQSAVAYLTGSLIAFLAMILLRGPACLRLIEEKTIPTMTIAISQFLFFLGCCQIQTLSQEFGTASSFPPSPNFHGFG